MNIKIIDRFNASFMIDNILVNAPAGILKKIKKELDDISIIIITHMHEEEYKDLPAIINHEFTRGRSKPLIIIGPKKLEFRTKRKVRKENGS